MKYIPSHHQRGSCDRPRGRDPNWYFPMVFYTSRVFFYPKKRRSGQVRSDQAVMAGWLYWVSLPTNKATTKSPFPWCRIATDHTHWPSSFSFQLFFFYFSSKSWTIYVIIEINFLTFPFIYIKHIIMIIICRRAIRKHKYSKNVYISFFRHELDSDTC